MFDSKPSYVTLRCSLSYTLLGVYKAIYKDVDYDEICYIDVSSLLVRDYQDVSPKWVGFSSFGWDHAKTAPDWAKEQLLKLRMGLHIRQPHLFIEPFVESDEFLEEVRILKTHEAQYPLNKPDELATKLSEIHNNEGIFLNEIDTVFTGKYCSNGDAVRAYKVSWDETHVYKAKDNNWNTGRYLELEKFYDLIRWDHKTYQNKQEVTEGLKMKMREYIGRSTTPDIVEELKQIVDDVIAGR